VTVWGKGDEERKEKTGSYSSISLLKQEVLAKNELAPFNAL
jgi:hypothetical protein